MSAQEQIRDALGYMTTVSEFIDALYNLSKADQDFDLLGEIHNTAIFQEALFKEAQGQIDAALKCVRAVDDTLTGGGS